MDVSVVVPTRNRSRLLGAALRSVLQQRDVSFEVVVVDEGSTDDTSAMLATIGDGRVRVVRHETPRGVSAARNHGADESRGEWVAFLDDDDLWAPGKLAIQLHAASAAGCDWAYTGAVNIDGRSSIVHGRPPLPPDEVMAVIRRYNAIPGGGSNVLVRRAALLRAGPFDTRLRNTEDWEMWIRLAKIGPPAWVCSPLLGYRVHPSNSSLDMDAIVAGARLIEALHDTTIDWGTLHRWLAESCLRTGRRAAAVAQFARAAVRNDALDVARDLAAIARRRVSGVWPVLGHPRPGHPAWIEEAAGWLREFEEED